MHKIAAALLSSLVATASAATLKSREEIVAAFDAGLVDTCADAPEITQSNSNGRKIFFVSARLRWKDEGVCSDIEAGGQLYVLERVSDGYRPIERFGTSDGTIGGYVFSHSISNDESHGRYTWLGITREYSGTGHFADSGLYRLKDDGSLEKVAVPFPKALLEPYWPANGAAESVVLGFADDTISFNAGSDRLSPYGRMTIQQHADGLTLVAEPHSVQVPSESRRFNELGVAAYRESRFEAAIEYYLHAIKWQNVNAEAHSNLGLVYLRQKKYDAAIGSSLKVFDLPNAPFGIRASAAYNAGRAFEAKGDRARAAENYARAVQLQPTDERRAAFARMGSPLPAPSSTPLQRAQTDTDKQWIGGRAVPVRSVAQLPGFRLFSPPKDISGQSVADIAPSSGKGYWLATDRGLALVDEDFANTLTQSNVPSQFGNSVLRLIAHDGRLFATVRRGTQSVGIASIDDKLKWTWIADVPGVDDIHFARSRLWYSGSASIGWVDAMTRTVNSVATLGKVSWQLAAADDEAWFTLYNGGIAHVDARATPAIVERFDASRGLRLEHTVAIEIDDARVWVSHGDFDEQTGGLSVVDRKTGAMTKMTATINNIPLGGQQLLRDGRYLYAGNDHGQLVELDISNEEGTLYTCSAVWPGCRIRRMVTIGQHVWLVLLPAGVARFDRH